MQATVLYVLVPSVAWVLHVIFLVSQVYHETLTIGKAVFHAVGILIPLLAPITVWFV